MTKLAKILSERNIEQKELQGMIIVKHNVVLGRDRICKMVNGVLTNYHIKTAKLIADTLDVGLDDIVD
jgi:hypothetical protein